MARDWQKYDYDRTAFGAWVRESRERLGWSLSRLARKTGINKGTLQQVEMGRRSLPADQRRTLVEVLSAALESSGSAISRRRFLATAGLATAELVETRS